MLLVPDVLKINPYSFAGNKKKQKLQKICNYYQKLSTNN